MNLISTGKSTILSNFSDLNTKATYEHTNGEQTDFQCYSKRQVFVEVKRSGLEVMRLKEREKGPEIQRVQKLNIPNVYCVGCAKQSVEDIVLGLSNGQVKVYNYKNSKVVQTFSADNIRNGVSFVDYNASDDYISSVLDSGQINLYGVKSSTKIETINIDGNSSLARFHPSKRFHLSIASNKGSVTIYDLSNKRKIYHSTNSHKAPCRDLCMGLDTPDTMISVGFDCLINIFDTRRKTQPIRLTHPLPLSTVAMSDCGRFFCVGNLKGELVTFDMRNTKDFLMAKKVHDGAVTRVAFMTTAKSESVVTDLTNSNTESIDERERSSLERLASGDMRKSVIGGHLRNGRDSFCDFLEFQEKNKAVEKVSGRRTSRRDSFDWETLNPKTGELRNGGLLQSSSPMDFLGSNNNNYKSPGNANDSSLDYQYKTPENVGLKLTHQISPMAPILKRNAPSYSTPHVLETLDELDKENTSQNNEEERRSSGNSEKLTKKPESPIKTKTPLREIVSNVITPSQAVIGDKLPESKSTLKLESNNALSGSDLISQRIEELRSEVMGRLEQLESEIKFNAETNKWQIFMQASKLRNDQMNSIEEIREALGVLLQTDPFVNEFMRLKEENQKLKAQLQQKHE